VVVTAPPAPPPAAKAMLPAPPAQAPPAAEHVVVTAPPALPPDAKAMSPASPAQAPPAAEPVVVTAPPAPPPAAKAMPPARSAQAPPAADTLALLSAPAAEPVAAPELAEMIAPVLVEGIRSQEQINQNRALAIERREARLAAAENRRVTADGVPMIDPSTIVAAPIAAPSAVVDVPPIVHSPIVAAPIAVVAAPMTDVGRGDDDGDVLCMICHEVLDFSLEDDADERVFTMECVPVPHKFHEYCIAEWAKSKCVPREQACPFKCHANGEASIDVDLID
jgi:hypothetical protein